MRISDWSSDVCSSDLNRQADARPVRQEGCEEGACQEDGGEEGAGEEGREEKDVDEEDRRKKGNEKDGGEEDYHRGRRRPVLTNHRVRTQSSRKAGLPSRSEEHTSELQSLMRISYAVFCLKKKIEKKSRQQYKEEPTNTKYM